MLFNQRIFASGFQGKELARHCFLQAYMLVVCFREATNPSPTALCGEGSQCKLLYNLNHVSFLSFSPVAAAPSLEQRV